MSGTSAAVSYTHLDVYKRQLEAFMASDQRFKFVSYGLVNGVVPNEAVRRVAMIPSQKEKTPWKLIFVAMFSL